MDRWVFMVYVDHQQFLPKHWERKVSFYRLRWPLTVLPKHWECKVSFYSLCWPLTVLPKHWESNVSFYSLRWPFTVLPEQWERTVSVYSLRWPSAVLPKHWECKIKHTQKIEKNACFNQTIQNVQLFLVSSLFSNSERRDDTLRNDFRSKCRRKKQQHASD